MWFFKKQKEQHDELVRGLAEIRAAVVALPPPPTVVTANLDNASDLAAALVQVKLAVESLTAVAAAIEKSLSLTIGNLNAAVDELRTLQSYADPVRYGKEHRQ